jgi:hypothetical protein
MRKAILVLSASLCALALMFGALGGIRAALSEQAETSLELVPGVVVDLTTNRVYVMRPGGGIAALTLAEGKTLWESSAAAKPLTVAEGLLVSQAEPKEEESALKIVTLDTEDKGRAVLEQTVPLPASVKPTLTRSASRSFNATADVVTGDAAVTWQYQERFVQGKRSEHEVLPGEPEPSPEALPPGALRTEQGEEVEGGPKTETANGAFRLDLRSGKVTPQTPAQRSAPIAPAGQAIELPPNEQLSGVPQPQFLSADGRHVLSPELVPGAVAGERYRWTIYDRATGIRLGALAAHVRYAPFFVTGSLLLYQMGPYERKTPDGMVEEPLQLRAVDLTTGKTVWSEEIRDVVERAAPAP